MWESPVYKFRKQIVKGDQYEYLNINIDVTHSVPPQTTPGDTLIDVFKVLTKNRPQSTKILDVGAGKLRNTMYLLQRGYNVYAVEFPELSKRLTTAKDIWHKAKRYSNFKRLVFPKDFFKFKTKVDIILLINVINVMPIPLERLTLLSLCREKIKKSGILLCYNWRDIKSNPGKYTLRNELNDGHFKGETSTYQTFHVEWDKDYLHEMFASAGFYRDSDYELGSLSSQAYVYKPTQPILLDKQLELSKVRRGGMKRNPSKTVKKCGKLRFPDFYVTELEKVKPGAKEATKFHHLSARLLWTTFGHQLREPIIENEINRGRKRIDIRFHNRNQPGFFKDLKEMYDVKCPSIFVECKNYASDMSNPEFDQLSGRLGRRGKFGILVCRNKKNQQRVLEHCRDRVNNKEEYIVVLDDKDLKTLTNLKRHEDGNDKVDDFMRAKIDEIID